VDLALFDFDGTITSRDTFTDFVRFAVSRRRLIAGQLVLMPLIVGYKLGVVPTHAIRAAIAHAAFRGADHARLRELGARFAREVIRDLVRPSMQSKIEWHLARGDTVAVVSASLDVYLEPWCAELGLDLLCTRIAVSDGVATGRYQGKDCCGPEKTRRVRERYDLTRYEVIHAYGDTHEDAELLALGQKKHYRGKEIVDLAELGRR